jgi:hypothetical protein
MWFLIVFGVSLAFETVARVARRQGRLGAGPTNTKRKQTHLDSI